ncbi:MAG: type I methionyl aminopeptidase [Candidatus Saccharimonadales bacterium]
MFTRVKTATEIEGMRESGRMLATVLDDVLGPMVAPGVSERALADAAARELRALGGHPAFKGYQGFPDVICISTNDKVVHGIPSDYVLRDGDIVSLDFGVTYRGMITDSARTFLVGDVDQRVRQLVAETKKSLDAGIATLHDGVTTGDIGAAVQRVLDMHHYGIVRDLVGHGVGHQLHEEPDIANYGHAGEGPTLRAGMTIAIEPMANLGVPNVVMDPDGWTIRTRDGQPSAHFEHTILILDDGAEVLTVRG